jgi:hypothetical protein
MDLMSLEHNFGNEYQDSLKHLFTFFCNNISLGQWEAARACLDDLLASKDAQFKSLLLDIIANPAIYW